MSFQALSLCFFLTLTLFGCRTNISEKSKKHEPSPPALIPVSIASQPLASPVGCDGSFMAHELPHVTTAGKVTRLFESNGAGLAINDLDNDGDLDIVLANLKGENTLLWNEGGLTFRRQSLPYRARSVAIVDVEGDGWQDIIFTRGSTPPLRWRNLGFDDQGQIRFELLPLLGLSEPAYAMNWGDLDSDGDLDIMTASYDAALMVEQGNSFLFSDGAGVFLYRQNFYLNPTTGSEEIRFQSQQFAQKAQALALSLADINGDQLPDIAVGNDFDLPDYYWLRTREGWQMATPFPTTSHSTMSFDQGDINNDGALEWFATDMKPLNNDLQTLAAWLPLMDKGYKAEGRAYDPQLRENVLQVLDEQGNYHNEAYARQLDATGWSWSSKFGDLDKDGFLDLYVVNGMIAQDLLAHLPNGELREANQALRNDGEGGFYPIPEWKLDATESGRGMSMGDLDGDGDLDVVINNLNASAFLFENQICQGKALEVELFWPQSKNQRALGAKLVLHTSTGDYTRDVRAQSGYLSGDPARLHFGIPTNSSLLSLDILWPDGTHSIIEQLAGANNLLIITRRTS